MNAAIRMANKYLYPGVYVEERQGGTRPIEAVDTSNAAFLGRAPQFDHRVNELVWVNNWTEFRKKFVSGPEGDAQLPTSTPLSHAVYGFFQNGGGRCCIVNMGKSGCLVGAGKTRRGLELLEQTDDVSIIAAPGFTEPGDYDAMLSHCEKMGERIAILDAPLEVDSIHSLTEVAVSVGRSEGEKSKPKGLRPRMSDGGYGAFYFPQIVVQDPIHPAKPDPVKSGSKIANLATVAPSGHIAGIYARTDSARGVHKAPANEAIRGALDISYHLTRDAQGQLNPNGVNGIRFFAGEGVRVYGARTVAPSGSEWRYINVRRLLMMIEASIARSTRWAVFEPNDHTLWAALRRDVSAFLTTIWRQGALFGQTPEQAFFVKCDDETNPTEEIDQGRVLIHIGVAPVKPAEFVIFRVSQSVEGAEIEGGD